MNRITLTDDELYWFDAVSHYYEFGPFEVFVSDTGEIFRPVFTVKQNGDIDGLEGWK